MPDQCKNCGRRFQSTPEGKQMKIRHMDWHFKVKSFDPDTTKRGIYRSWYIDEKVNKLYSFLPNPPLMFYKEWIEFREQDEASLSAGDHSNLSESKGNIDDSQSKTKQKYILVPSDPILVQAPCPICQEAFKSVHLSEVNDWVWMDAIKVNNKIYHASCWEEMHRGLTSADAARTGTPDSVLGKRKAEVIKQTSRA
jgi:pre-mRNA cleavage complex 2 protein Pcf11